VARVTVTLAAPTPKVVPMVGGRPIRRRPRLGLSLMKQPVTPKDTAKQTKAIKAMEAMLADVLSGRSNHPVTAVHIDSCRTCRLRKQEPMKR
jgi:hypothetical protein